MDAFTEAIARPATQSIVAKAIDEGFQQRSELELNVGAYIGNVIYDPATLPTPLARALRKAAGGTVTASGQHRQWEYGKAQSGSALNLGDRGGGVRQAAGRRRLTQSHRPLADATARQGRHVLRVHRKQRMKGTQWLA
jgi:hypothetical protein